MKPILLIFPPYDGKSVLVSRPPFPIGLLYIAAYLREREIASEIIDFSYPHIRRRVETPEAITKQGGITRWSRYGWSDLQIIMWLRRNLHHFHSTIGVSSLMSSNYPGFYKVIKFIKSVNKDTTVIGGGPHATAEPDHVFRNTPVDLLCIGEGEEAFYNLLVGREHEAIVDRQTKKIAQRQAFITDMDSLPFPDRDLLKDTRKLKELYITFSRGCPHKCSFCGSYKIQGRRWRHKSVGRAFKELEFYHKEWGINKFIVEDDNLTPGKVGIRWMKELCQKIIEGLPKLRFRISHGIPVYASADKELCDLMWKAGFRKMVFPLESTNPETLKHMNKSGTPENWKKGIKNWSYEKAHPTEIIIGYPFVETIESMLQTLIDISKQRCKSWASHFRLHRGIPLYQQCLDAGYINKSYDTLNASTFFIETERWNIKELKEIMRISKALNFGIEQDFDGVTDDPYKPINGFQIVEGVELREGNVIGDGKFKFKRSQNVFAGILIQRIWNLKGKPKITYSKDNTQLIYMGEERNRVYRILEELIKKEG